MAANKQGKMAGYINYRMRVTMNDGRQLVGQLLAFDKHMNVVLADCEEFRRVRRKAKTSGAPGASASAQTSEIQEKRMLGLAIVRGATVVSLSVDGPPPSDPSLRVGATGTGAPGGGGAPPTVLQAGPGISRPAGRGASVGLQGPAAGVGGPGFGGPGFPGAPPMGFPGRGGPPGFPPTGFPPAGGPPPGFAPQGFQPPPSGRGFPGGPPGR